MIYFVHNWGENPERSWSGTPMGIHNAFKKQIKIQDIKIHLTKKDLLRQKLKRGVLKLKGKKDFEELRVKLEENKIRDYPYDDAPIFMFSEYITPYLSHSYVFIDLSVDYLYDLYITHSEMLDYCQSVSINVDLHSIQKRREMSLSYMQDCQGIFTMSKWLRDDLVNRTHIPESKVHYVGGGCNIDSSMIQDGLKQGNKFLFIGTDFKCKNGKLVYDAFRSLQKKYPEIELYIAGPDKQPETIETGNGVYFLGYRTHEQIAELYNQCDYFVMPSLFDAYGLVFGEALIYGLPCIGKNILAMPEFIESGKNGYLLENNDLNELCDLMEKMMLNKDMKQYVYNHRNDYIQQYSWEKVTNRMIDVMKKDGYLI